MPLQSSTLFEPIADSQIQAIIRASISSTAGVASCRLIDGGHFNTSYDIRTSNPDRHVVLRIAPRDDRPLLDYEHTMMLAEPKVYDVLARAGVPVPNVIAVDGSRSVVDRVYMLMDFVEAVPLTHPSVPADARAYLMREAGRYMAIMHGITGERFGRIAPDGSVKGPGSWAEFFGEILNETVDKCIEAHALDDDLGAVPDLYAKHREVFDECRGPVLVHNDFWDPNILVREEDGVWRIEAIIDADRAVFADREYEYALWENADPDLLAGYAVPLDQSDNAQLRRKFYRLQLYLIYAWFYKAPTSYPEFQAYSGKIAEEIMGEMLSARD